MEIIERPSPNFSDRPSDTVIDLVVLHYTGMVSGAAALNRLSDATAQVSAHYLIEEDASIYRLVAEHKRAWHAGFSHWAGATDINDRSIGIEIVNPGHEFGYRPFPEAQMAAVETLLAEILARHAIPANRVVGHSDIAPSRKQDPGELFDWQRLAARGLSVWPVEISAPAKAENAMTLLSQIGYDPAADAADVVTAFQRRFLPDNVNGNLDERTLAMIASVHAING
jgi:N-acetylmuramoyl-L-alanine amidase